MSKLTQLMHITSMPSLAVLITLTVLSSANAHVTYNVGGFGDIAVGASNSTIGGEGATRIYLGGTTGGGLAGSLYHSGSTNGNEVWTNESPATEWIGPTGPNHAGSSAGSVLPSAAYVGLHTPTQVRLLETGVYGSTPTICATNGDCVGINTNHNSLLRQVYTQNHNPSFYIGGPSNTNPLPTDFALAVAPNSWNNGLYNPGMDVLNPHVSGYQFGFPNDFTLHPNLEQNLLDQAPGIQLYLNIDVFDDTSDGLGPQQMGVVLYGGWDDGNGLSDLTYLGSALAPVGGNAQLTYALTGQYFGEYTVLIGDNSSHGGQYKALFTISSTPLTTPVPAPAALTLFGGGLSALAGLARRRAKSASWMLWPDSVQRGKELPMRKTGLPTISLLCALAIICSSNANASTVYLGDPNPGGLRYHLYFSFDHPGTLTAATGQPLPQIGNPADRQDFNSDGLVDEVGLKAWRGLFDPPGPLPPDEYGWSLNSRWSVVDLTGLHANGYGQAQVSITLEANTTPPVATDKVLIPAVTAWSGIETTGTASFTNNWYPNGISTTNWSDWWATDLAASALAGHVWAAADDSTVPTHTVTLTLPWMTLTGTNDYLTLVFGGNDFNQSNPFEFPNFTARVTVAASPVPLPTAMWLFGSGVIGLAGLARRRARAASRS